MRSAGAPPDAFLGRAIRCALLIIAVASFSHCAQSPSVDDEKSDAGKAPDAGLADVGWPCTIKTCKEINANCGQASDGCGGLISCGTCPTDQFCGGAGANRCGTEPCAPGTCASAGAECGPIGDGCGVALDCGTCPAPAICGANGQPNHCGCVPKSCADQGKNCGSISDGCGSTLDCGSCPAGQKCGAGAVANVCGCEPATCATAGAECGSISDNCGGTLSCGNCTAPKTCGGLGKPNVCGCSPQACPPIYSNSFETDAEFPSGWATWHNCATDSTWSIARAPYPAPNGGSSNLRFHATGFATSCTYPGAYALTPEIDALPGRNYRVELWSRNAANVGNTRMLFFDVADQEIGGNAVVWTPDAWQYSADPPLTATSPAGTVRLRVRLEMLTPLEYADVDLLKIYLEPL